MSSIYETVVGLEIHVQLSTNSKLFCACSTVFTREANTNICPVCTGQLGALPVLNEKAVDYAIKAAIALNCKINEFSVFDRKNYFYPDLPKGYQISQLYRPYAEHGFVEIDVDGSKKKIGITRIHIEEDAGKLIHSEFTNETYVDFNRCSMPLIEIVSEPQIRSGEEAYEYLNKVKTLIKYLEVSDVSMELGSLRCDANISIRKKGDEKLGTRVEVKNLNSFKAVMKAIEYEAKRHESVLSMGEKITQETRLWDEARLMTRSMRSKEEAKDYRYFPDADLLPVMISQERISNLKKELPEFPDDKKNRFIKEYAIPEYDAAILVTEKALANYFENMVKISKNPKISSNWILTEVLRILKDKNIEIENFSIEATRLGKLISLIDKAVISSKIAKDIFNIMLEDKKDPEEIVKEKGLTQITDENFISKIVDKVLEENRSSIEMYKKGKTNALGFLVGQVIKESQGKANPQAVNKLILEKIEKI